MPYVLFKRALEHARDFAAGSAAVPTALAAWFAAALGNWFASYEASFTPLYLAAVCVVAWQSGWPAGLLLAAASVANQVAVGIVLGHPYSNAGYFALDTANTAFVACLVVALVGGLKLVCERERTHARIDPLTGALNGLAFVEALSVELARHRREGGPFAVAYIDCDDFKSVNARLGHRAGDALLRVIVDALHRGLRKTDVVARRGGDEFALLLPKTGTAAAQNVLDQLLPALSMATASQDFTVTFSVGVVVFEEAPASEDIVLSSAEDVMNRAKKDGKNRAVYETVGSRAEVAPPARAAGG